MSWSLFVNDIAQSYVDFDDPSRLEFDYTRWIGSVIDAMTEPGRPIRVLHLGGGALTLPRYIEATRPGSVQCVAEVDARLAAFVDEELPRPGTNVDVVVDDAARVLAGWPDDDLDLIITDAFRAARMQEDLAGDVFARHAARTLRPGGCYIVNVIDTPPYRRWRKLASILTASFAEAAVIAGHDREPHPRFDNIVLAASPTPGTLDPERMRAASLEHETRVAPAIGPKLAALLAD
ncbi:spermidine synthase [Stackebrandtia soli]|uniref:spermidine synthase n=1 Tax=Stackebrandtia soli TaxID=1892856 RepID=UPI0039E7EB36